MAGEIRNTIVMKDETSGALEAIKSAAMGILGVFAQLANASEEFAGSLPDSEIRAIREETAQARKEQALWNLLTAENRAEQQAVKLEQENTKKATLETKNAQEEVRKATLETKKAQEEVKRETLETKQAQSELKESIRIRLEEIKEQQALVRLEQMQITKENIATANATNGWKRVLTTIKPLLAGIVGLLSVRGVLGYMRLGRDAAREELRIRLQLQDRITRQVHTMEQAVAINERLLRQASELQASTGINAGQWHAGAAAILQFTTQAESAEILMRSIGDMAVGISGTLNLTSHQMEVTATGIGRAMMGQTRYLERQGIHFSEIEKYAIAYGNEMERTLAIAAAVERRFGGAAEQLMQAPEGVRAAMRNMWGDAQQAVGGIVETFQSALGYALLPMIERITQAIERGAAWAQENIQEVTFALTALGVVALAVAAKFAIAWAIKLWPILKIVAAIGGAIAILRQMGVTTGDILGFVIGLFMGLWETIKTVFQAFWQIAQSVLQAIGGLFENLSEEADEAIMDIKVFFLDLLEVVFAVIAGIINKTIDFANFFGHVFQDPLAAAQVLFMRFGERILAIIRPIASIIGNLFGWDWGGHISDLQNSLQGRITAVMEEAGLEDRFERLDPVAMRESIVDAFSRGREIGNDIADRFEGAFDRFSAFDPSYGGWLGDFDTVSTGLGQALLVSDPANREIFGELLRLHEDVSTVLYARGVYQNVGFAKGGQNGGSNTAGNITINQQIYPSAGMNEEAIAQRAGQYAADYVSKQIRSTYRYAIG